MAEHYHSGPAELGAPMDYAAHERTYAAFISMTQISVLTAIDAVLALVLFGFGRGGFWLGALLLVLTAIAATIAIAGKGSLKPLAVVTVIGVLFLALSVT